MSPRKILVLSGGSGSRLWPLSRRTFPKQFFPIGQDKVLLEQTLERLSSVAPATIITGKILEAPTRSLLHRCTLKADLIFEPEARNTAAAIALGTLMEFRKDPKSTLGVFPSDHYIENSTAFADFVEKAFQRAGSGEIVTLGIQPTAPSDAYGYMELDPSEEDFEFDKVKRFIEKPSLEKAKTLLEKSRVVWNAGIFIFRADVLVEAFKTHLRELWNEISRLKDDLSNIDDVYGKLPSISIDYGIMEKLEKILCLPIDVGWSDLGSWEQVAEISNKKNVFHCDSSGNRYLDFNSQNKKAAFIGVDDCILVDTDDAVLLVKSGMGQKNREIYQQVKESDPDLVEKHHFEERPWGRFEIIFDSPYCKSKRILVLPHQKLSYQSHKHREENWTVIKGEAKVTLEDKVHSLTAGEHIHIPTGAKHRIANESDELLEIIEVQSGSYFGEDDIIRYSDDYGRS